MENSKLNIILENFEGIEKKLSNIDNQDYENYAKLSKEYSDLKPLVEKINTLFRCEKEIIEVNDLLLSEDEEIKIEAGNEKNLLVKKK